MKNRISIVLVLCMCYLGGLVFAQENKPVQPAPASNEKVKPVIPWLQEHDQRHQEKDHEIAQLKARLEQLEKYRLFYEDFEQYTDGYLSGGWILQPNCIKMSVGIGSELGTKVANPFIDSREIKTSFYKYPILSYPIPLIFDAKRIYTLSCDAYAYDSNGKLTHNSRIGFSSKAGYSIEWCAASGYWSFLVSCQKQERIPLYGAGYNKRIRLSIVMDINEGKCYGIFDFGEGQKRTKEVMVDVAELQKFDAIFLYQYYSSCPTNCGAEYDNIQLILSTK